MHKNILSPVFHPSTCALDFMHFLEIRFLNSFKHQSAPQQPYTQCQQNLYFEFTDVFLPVFQKRVNLSLESGTVSRTFKKAVIKLLNKTLRSSVTTARVEPAALVQDPEERSC